MRDAELQARVAVGDQEAFEELYRRYAAPAYGLALRVLASEQLAQDVVHDAFLALWRAPEAFDPARGSFRSFFLSLVHHRSVDTVRREERLRRRTQRMNLQAVQDEQDVADRVAQDAWLVDLRDRVVKALDTLSDEQREVVELAYFEGLTQARIAERTGVPLGTVKTRTLAALRRLRRVLEEDDE
jgi:RNA polymerase sigma-70 factor (ECF subfamily)